MFEFATMGRRNSSYFLIFTYFSVWLSKLKINSVKFTAFRGFNCKIYLNKLISFSQALSSLSLSVDYWIWRLTLSTMKLNYSMQYFPYWLDYGGFPSHQLKVCSFSSSRKNATQQILMPQLNSNFHVIT